ncbi:MAG: ABC transporter permease subunit [Sulfolobus sp.]
MRSVLYDFKRSFLRLSVLLLLVLFILGGIGISYSVFHILGINPSAYENLNVAGFSIISSLGTIHVYGIVFNNMGQPVSGATICVHYSGGVMNTTTSSEGLFNLSIPYSNSLYAIVKYDGMVRNVSLIGGSVALVNGPYVGNVGINGTIHVANGINNVVLFTNISMFNDYGGLSNSYSPYDPIFIAIMNHNHLVMFTYERLNVSLSFLQANSNVLAVNSSGVVLKEYNFSLKPFTPVYTTIEVPSEANYVRILSNSSFAINPYSQSPILYTKIVTGYFSAMGLFLSFFPFVVIYLAYAMFAKPRDTGALEFILARPITKGELYMTRFSANAITAIVASFLINISPNVAFISIAGLYLSPQFILLASIIPMTSLLTYLSITYMYASLIKSGGTTLGLGIATYIIVQIAIPVIGFMSGNYTLIEDYIVPGSISQAIQSYLEGATISVNVGLELLSTILWIVVPLVIGYLAFKRKDI